MRIQSEVQDALLVLQPMGKRLDAAEAIGFKAFVFEQVAKGHTRIGIDFSEVEFIDSSGLGCLVSCLKHIGARGSLFLCNPQSAVQTTFKLSRMDKVFRIFESREAMVAQNHG